MFAKKKTISRVLSLVLIVALIAPALLVVPVSAASVVLTGDAGYGGSVTFYLYDDGLIDFQGTGSTLNYTSASSSPWYSHRASIASASFSEGITHIGNYCLSGAAVVSVTFPSTLTVIGRSAFRGCSFTSVVIPALVETIQPYAFYDCNSLKDVYFTSPTPPVLLDSNYPFDSCDSLVNMYVPEGSLSAYVADFPSKYHAYLKEGSPPIGESILPFGVLQSWLDTDIYTFVENSSATSFTVAIDGGSVAPTYSYQWYYGSSQGGGFTAISNETQASFTPKTSAEYIGTSLYFCRITAELDGATKSADSGYLQVTVTEEPPPTTDPPVTEPSEPDAPVVPDETTPDYSEKLEDIQGSLDDVNNSIGEVGDKVDELPDKITDGMEDIIEQEKEQATQQGGQFVDDISGVVPNDSQGFIDALGSLVSVLSYDGTECVLPIPALTLPAIGGLFPSYTVMDAQEVDFEEFFAMMPPKIMLLVQSLLTVALIVYCFKEFYDTVAYFFVLKGGNK